jgi:hypothetical protein
MRVFADGADCPVLFEIRNDARRTAAEWQVQVMNDRLRSVQCFTASSRRAATTGGDGTFTVKEYRIYRTIIDTPPSVSEPEALRRVATQFKVTPEQAKAIATRVSDELSRRNWYANPMAEIRHASDWNGEQR